MDARAGGATEADEASIPIGLIQEGLMHTNVTTTGRYIRGRSRKIATIAEARKLSRPAAGDNGTASEPAVRITSESQGKS